MTGRADPIAWWRGAVLYQVYPRSFRDGDGDGIGDLAGLLAGLDHIAGLGVDGLWLGPVYPSPQRDFGYDVADQCAVDPVFGTLADLDRLIEAAHGRGLKVILDLVLSHTADRHPWFAESRTDRSNPKADWYVWAEPKPDGSPPNNWLSVFGGPAWTWEARRGQYYFHNFLAGQPDLNLHHEAVVAAQEQVLRFWLDRGVDGFRLDTVNFYRHDPALRDNPAVNAALPAAESRPFTPYRLQRHVYDKSRPETLPLLRRLRRVLDAYPDRMALAEVEDDAQIKRAAEYTAAADLLHTAYCFALFTERFDSALIRETVSAFEGQPGQAWPSWAFSNHDVVRAVSRWRGGRCDPAPAFAKLLIALLGSLRGTALLYQGEELGLPEADLPVSCLQDPFGRAFWPVFKGRDGCRTPMPWRHDAPAAGFSTGTPWLPVPQMHRPLAVDLQTADPDSVLAFTRRFLHWRGDQPALRWGDILVHDTPEPLLCFDRSWDGVTVRVALNLGEDAQSLALPGGGVGQVLTGAGLAGTMERGRAHMPGYGGVYLRL